VQGRPQSTLARLLALQDIDAALLRLEHKRATLEERRELAEAQQALARLRASIDEATRRRQTLAEHQAELERQVTTLTARRQTLEDRLYGARGMPGRDLQAIEGEVAQLGRKKDELEDQQLALLEEQEPLEEHIASEESRAVALETRIASLQEAVVAAEQEIDAEAATLRTARAPAAEGLPSELLARYDRLRAQLGGIGVARLVGRRCDGCHLELPAVELDRIAHLPADALVFCEHCGRILVRDRLETAQ